MSSHIESSMFLCFVLFCFSPVATSQSLCLSDSLRERQTQSLKSQYVF